MSDVVHDDFAKMLAEVRGWHVRVFGSQVDVKRTVLKLLEEASEAHMAGRNMNCSIQAGGIFINEICDVMLVCFSLLTPFMGNVEDYDVENIAEGIRNKMAIVESRDQIRRDYERGISREAKPR